MFLSIASLILFAPRLPPIERMVFFLVFNPKNFIPSSLVTLLCDMLALTGLPVIIIFSFGKNFSIPSLATKILVALLPSMILLLPAKELLSCIKVFIPFVWANFNTGKLE